MGDLLLRQRKLPLFLFYKALVLLYLERDAVGAAEQALRDSDEPVSEYYFIYALALHRAGQSAQGLAAISRAIELDPAIQEFYRERAKHYFVAEDLEAALADCRKAESLAPEDEEVPLLLSFLLYLRDDFALAHQYLQAVQPSSGKLLEFELALCLRLGLLERLGELGELLRSLEGEGAVPA